MRIEADWDADVIRTESTVVVLVYLHLIVNTFDDVIARTRC